MAITKGGIPVEFEPLAIPDVVLITPRRFGDARGVFFETYSREKFAQAGIDTEFVQANHSHSVEPGTLRGLHLQAPPHAQAKLVRCIRGAILDVAVDVRVGSPTYGQHVAVELTGESGRQLFIPAGFAHGFATLEPACDVSYMVDHAYASHAEGGLKWDDPGLAIDWRLPVPAEQAVVSDRDRSLPGWSDWASPFVSGRPPDAGASAQPVAGGREASRG